MCSRPRGRASPRPSVLTDPLAWTRQRLFRTRHRRLLTVIAILVLALLGASWMWERVSLWHSPRCNLVGAGRSRLSRRRQRARAGLFIENNVSYFAHLCGLSLSLARQSVDGDQRLPSFSGCCGRVAPKRGLGGNSLPARSFSAIDVRPPFRVHEKSRSRLRWTSPLPAIDSLWILISSVRNFWNAAAARLAAG